MDLNLMFEAGIRSGWMLTKMESLGKKELKSRIPQLPEAEQRTFEVLMQIQDATQLPFQLGLASLLRLTAAVLDEPEEKLVEQMDQEVAAVKEYLENKLENGGLEP
ncbi:hypothetical protein D1646_04465 [Pseudoflavonifractor sp. 60]|uniref:hypothetical protein n=1 Tax=Pseudoflavonifractor sp. 60 TaxID=2304576 RepID=UPI00136E07FF|nr:hypothetical protein [Pseudoflavonifractor sp. 60]NBI66076.1 hypothetical protein [Pseudoflavonifractor sp. 60]